MTVQEEFDYSKTVNLPKTEFPQRGNLPQREPLRVKKWQDMHLTGKLRERRDRPDYVFHDGPPYANGDIHIGHALNKSLKDMIVRYKTMAGFRVHYVHGSDCHGLPIEQKVVEELRKQGTYDSKSPLEIRELCAESARYWMARQREQFERLGIGGEWEKQYVTMDPRYETAILGALRSLVEKGYVYKGLKVVHWDPVFETALAEAEIVYNDDHVSSSIYVKFPLLGDPPVESLKGGKASVVIWTTTPWTLPANLAVCLHPSFEYVAWRSGGETYVVAKGLLESFKKETGLTEGEVVEEFSGAALENQRCQHPLLPKESLLILGDHVTLEQGTGCVHTAPGHGVEDFEIGKRYGLEVFNPVDERGRFTAQYPGMEGVSVFDANKKIVEKMRADGTLLADGPYKHSYPYSWRSRKPVIMRATEQWFMAVDKDGLREKALAECENVEWIPKWGYERITNMLRGRPDWCLSRQRSWGVPIPSIVDKRTRQGLLPLELIDKFIGFVSEEGTDCWYRRPLEDFLPESMKAEAEHYEKEFNTFDVWFDSGSSHLAVLNDGFDLKWPADLYLEGADQHRGWFQHSLWVAVGVKGSSPFRAVLTHGFVLDEQKRPMSKSLGNVISPLKVVEQNGADVLRMWVSSEDYRGDVSISPNALKQIANAYRRIRNTLRFVLGNLADFDPVRHAVPFEQLGEDDRWVLSRLNDLVRKVHNAYERFEFHRVYHLVNGFCITELGSLYLDMVKDRLYCSAADDAVRRSTQTALHHIGSALPRLLAPIVPFTADEAWEHLPGNGPVSCVHLEDFPQPHKEWENAELAEKWERLLTLRAEVTRQIEPLRAKENKVIGNSLDARIVLRATDPETLAFLRREGQWLADFFIVSQVAVEENEPGAVPEELRTNGLFVSVEADKARGRRCPRCWHWFEGNEADAGHPELCPRCADVLRRTG